MVLEKVSNAGSQFLHGAAATHADKRDEEIQIAVHEGADAQLRRQGKMDKRPGREVGEMGENVEISRSGIPIKRGRNGVFLRQGLTVE